MQTTRPLYYLVISLITQFILAIAALILLTATSLLDQMPWGMIAFLLAYNVLVATLAGIGLTNHNEANHAAVLKGSGLVLGHLVGILLGGFIGSKVGGVLGAAAGAGIMYFAMGWVGACISIAIGGYLDRQTSPTARRNLETALQRAHPNVSALIIYAVALPALFLAAAMMLKSSGMPTAQNSEILPIARVLLVGVSLCSILIPWLRGARSKKAQRRAITHWFAISFVGLGLSLAPAIYGFLLFVAFGLSIAELAVFAFVASVAVTTWGVSHAGK